jgi:hypothetical protein
MAENSRKKILPANRKYFFALFIDYKTNNAPAMVPLIIVANEAASNARGPSLDKSPCRKGAIPPIPPI